MRGNEFLEKFGLIAPEYIEEAEEKGIEQGSLDKSYEIARNMLKENTDIEFISKVTGLNIDQIKKLESN